MKQVTFYSKIGGRVQSVFRQFEIILYNPCNMEDTASKSFPERTVDPDSKIAAAQIWPTRAESGPNKPELARCARCLVNSANPGHDTEASERQCVDVFWVTYRKRRKLTVGRLCRKQLSNSTTTNLATASPPPKWRIRGTTDERGKV